MANVGSVDRVLRALLGIILLVLPLIPATAAALGWLGAWIWMSSVVGVALLLTAVFRFCPAYTVFGLRTCSIN